MGAIWIVAGFVLIAAGAFDLFMTVLYYDTAGPFSLRLYRFVWALRRRVATKVPDRHTYFVLSLGVPLMVLGSLILWITMQVLGFASIYYAGLHAGAFRLSEGWEPSLVEALYLSGISLPGLGYGDIGPVTAPYQLVAAGRRCWVTAFSRWRSPTS